jgi:hypothetical protein
MSTVPPEGLSRTPSPILPPPPAGGPRPAAEALPVHVPGYEVLAALGEGGMGVVYQARQVAADRVVALKMVRGGEHASADARARFRTEIQAVARLQHPHIVQVHEVGEHDGRPFFSMEYCPGGGLDRKLAGAPLEPAEAARLAEALARAVHAAHLRQVVHRDLKPANVLLTADGTPKISDFGLARKLDEVGQTQTGEIVGTPSYMAPEQVGGSPKGVGPAADVWALGVILYECLTGRPPFKAATPLGTLGQVLRDDPVPPRRLQPGTPRDLETVCLKCLEKDPKKRYATAEALAEDLRRFLGGEPVKACPLGPIGRGAKWARRRPAVAGLLALCTALLLAGTGGSAYFAVVANFRAGQADANRRAAREQQSQAEANLALAQERWADGLLGSIGRDNTGLLAGGGFGFGGGSGGANALGSASPLERDHAGVDDSELNALWDLASLPKEQERVRVLFIERALSRPETAARLTRRSDLVVHAAVGLDQARRSVVCQGLQARVADRGVDVRIHTACAAALAELAPGEEDADEASQPLIDALSNGADGAPLWDRNKPKVFARRIKGLTNRGGEGRVARRLLDAMAATSDPQALAALAEGLAALAPRLDEAAAREASGAAARRLLEAMARADSLALTDLSSSLGALAPWLDAAAAGDAARRLLDLREHDPDQLSRWEKTQALAALAPRLDAAAADAAGRRLLDAMGQGAGPLAGTELSPALAAVAPRMSEAAAREATSEALRRILEGETWPPQFPGGVVLPTAQAGFVLRPGALAALAPRLDQAAAEEAGRKILEAMEKAPPPARGGYAGVLATVLPRMGEAAAHEASGRAARAFLEALSPNADPRTFSASAQALGAVLPRMGEAEAREASRTAARRLLDAAARTTGPVALAELAAALEVTAPRLDGAEAEEAARCVVGTLVKLAPLVRGSTGGLGLTPLPGLMLPAKEPAAPGVLTFADQMELHGVLPHVVAAVGALAPRLNESAAEEAARRLLEAMDGPAEVLAQMELAGALAALTPRLERRVAGEAAERLLDDMDKTADANVAWSFVPALAALAPRLDGPTAERAARRALDAMDRAPRPMVRAAFAQAAAALAPRLSGDAAGEAVRRILAVMDQTAEPTALAGFARALEAAAPFTDGPTTAAAAQRVLDVMTLDPVVTGLGAADNPDALPAIASALGRQETVQLLKHPGCVGEVRGLVLRPLGRKLGRQFGDEWELVDWLAVNAPEVDLLSPPLKPGP